jgi:hypothetical protein
VVDVADGANVDVRFGPIKFLFRHDSPSLASGKTTFGPLPTSDVVKNALGWLANRSSLLRCGPPSRLRRDGGQPSRSSERRLELMTGIEPVTSSLPRTRSAN